MQPDLFDILDVSQREDSYTRLIVEVLNSSPAILEHVFAQLTGKRVFSGGIAQFRKQFAGKRSNDIPDVVIDAQSDSGLWRLLIESKIQSSEGEYQCARYTDECRLAVAGGELAGFTLVYLTLSGQSPNAPGWISVSHFELAQLIGKCDVERVLQSKPALSLAWSTFVARLTHYEGHCGVNENASILDWLLQTEDQYFVTRNERARMLGSTLVTALGDFAGFSRIMTKQGREQLLIQLWLPRWATGVWIENGDVPLEECVSVHFELDVPIPFNRSIATLHLHCEANPYLSQSEVKGLGNCADGFLAFADCFRDSLHGSLDGTGWQPTNSWLQKARWPCPFEKATTIASLRNSIRPQLENVAAKIDAAMMDAGKRRNLKWSRSFPSRQQQ